MSTTRRMIVSVLALSAFLAGLFVSVAHSSTPSPVVDQVATEALEWTAEDYPIRVSTIEGGVRAEIKDYVDLECLGCTDDEAVIKAEEIMSKVIAESLPVGEPLDVADPMPSYVPGILLDMGWYGVQGDGCECLYPPTFVRPIAA